MAMLGIFIFLFSPLSFFDGHSVDEKMGLSEWSEHLDLPHLTSKAVCKGRVASAEMRITLMPPSTCLKFLLASCACCLRTFTSCLC